MRISDWSSDVCSSDLITLFTPYREHATNQSMTIVVHGKDIVAELDAIYQDALQNLRSAMLRFAADGTVPGPEALAQRLFCYPELRITHAGSWDAIPQRSEEHTSELQSLMRISYAVFCLKKKKKTTQE